MASPSPTVSPVKFGPFELDLRSGDLKRAGRRERLQGQPAQLLVVLVSRRGELVTREELRTQLWPQDTFVDFDHGLNNAVNRIREVLGDSAASPRYIETVPRRGYRFIGELEEPSNQSPPLAPVLADEIAASAKTPASEVRGRRRTWLWSVAGLVLIAVTIFALGRRMIFSKPAIKSLVVLPFVNLSGDAEQEYFADGMTDELTSDLAKIGALRVISRTSAMRYKGTKKTAPEIARELEADGVIEGSVLRSGGRVRITAQLIDARADQHLWSDSYERDLKDVLALQDNVAVAIADQVRARLTPEEHAQFAGRRPVDPVAYDAYLRGRFYWNKRTDAGLRKAADEFRQAIARDPQYAPAYSGLADALTTRMHYQFDAPLSILPEELAAALKAVALDESSAEAHASLASAYEDEWDWSGAESEYRKAIALNPRYATAHHWLADYLSALGRHEEALAEEQRALALEPLSPIINTWMARRYYHARRYQEAYDAVRQALELEPGFEPGLLHQGMICVQLRRYDEARAALQKAVNSSGGGPIYVALLAYTEAMAGNEAAAKRMLAQLISQPGQHYMPSYMVAQIYVAMNDKPRAMQWLKRAFDDRSDWMLYVRVDPALDPIRSDPRFVELVRRVNLPE